MARERLQVSYPVVLTKRLTLRHHLVQRHYQRFYEQASIKLASVQGLRLNPGQEDALVALEKLFDQLLHDSLESSKASIAQWTGRLESAGVDASVVRQTAGLDFDAALTTPWNARLCALYEQVDHALLLIEAAWIAGEINGIQAKIQASNEARQSLNTCVRQIQRAVTQAFQEARRRDDRLSSPPVYGDAGKHLLAHAPEALIALKAVNPRDEEALRACVDDLCARHAEDQDTLNAIRELASIRVALARRRDAAKGKEIPEVKSEDPAGAAVTPEQHDDRGPAESEEAPAALDEGTQKKQRKAKAVG